jgi:sugar-specific transcriptional regulator TrmB
LPTLQKLGLADKIVARPTIYRAIPLEDGFSMLLHRRTEEYNELQNKAKLVFNNFIVNNSKVDSQEETSQFIITSERKLFLKKFKEDVSKAQASINIIYSKIGMSIIAFHVVEQIEKAMTRGVKIRAITNKVEEKSIDRNIQALKKNPAFELKFIANDISVGLVIFDNKAVKIRMYDKISPSLWTNNRNIVKLAEIYFESVWNNAQIE